MIAEFVALMDLPENRRCRFADPDRKALAERIHARRDYRNAERAMHGRSAL